MQNLPKLQQLANPEHQNNKRKLSPFTWSNIKLPPVSRQLLSIEEQSLKQIKQKVKKNKPDKIQNKQEKKTSINMSMNVTQKFKPHAKKKIEDRNTHKQHKSISVTIVPSQQSKQSEKSKAASNTITNQAVTVLRKNRYQNNKIKGNRKSIQFDLQHSPKNSLNRSIQTANDIKSNSNNNNNNNNFLYLASKVKEFQFQSSQMEPYIRKVLVQNNWFFTRNPKYESLLQNRANNNNNNNGKPENTLIWTKNQQSSIYHDMRPWQFYNHIQGSFNLTMKDKLHEHLSLNGSQFYPRSYFLNKQYEQFVEQYDANAVKSVVKILAGQIKKFLGLQYQGQEKQQSKKSQESQEPEKLFVVQAEQLEQMSLSDILDDLVHQTNQQTLKLIRLCLFVDNYCKGHKMIQYFKKFDSYRKVQVSITQTIYNNVLQWCLQLINNYHNNKRMQNGHQNEQYQSSVKINFNLQDVDYKILILILHFDKMFRIYDQQYLYGDMSYHNVWIGKPFGSSRGAGIFLIKDSVEFHRIRQNFIFQLKTKSKLQNKIIQKYIEKPLILKSGQFKNRKFDIRQWVLVISGQKPSQKFIYRYHTAYCRFSSKAYILQSNNLSVHLTNYQLIKKSQKLKDSLAEQQQLSQGTHASRSVMMLHELYEELGKNNKNKDKDQFNQGERVYQNLEKSYNEQIDNIVNKTVGNSRFLKYQQGTFQLFGFDVMFDESGNLFLLQINLNPKCSSERDELLKQQAEKMVQSMFELIFYGKQKKTPNIWIPMLGNKKTEQTSTKITKIQQQTIDMYFGIRKQQSLLVYVNQRRKSILQKMVQAVQVIHQRQEQDQKDLKVFFDRLKQEPYLSKGLQEEDENNELEVQSNMNLQENVIGDKIKDNDNDNEKNQNGNQNKAHQQNIVPAQKQAQTQQKQIKKEADRQQKSQQIIKG